MEVGTRQEVDPAVRKFGLPAACSSTPASTLCVAGLLSGSAAASASVKAKGTGAWRSARVSNDRLNRGFTTDMKCDMAILAHMAVGALEYGAAGDFLALLVAFWRAQR